jgi:hypothetical protein
MWTKNCAADDEIDEATESTLAITSPFYAVVLK